MKTLYFDCSMGAAGDMLTAALLELLPDPAGFVDRLNALGIPGVLYKAESAVKHGIQGTHMRVTVQGQEEHESLQMRPHEDMSPHPSASPIPFPQGEGFGSERHHHEHDHEHSHEHPHGHEAHTHDPSAQCPAPGAHEHHHTGLHGMEHLVRDHLALPEAVRQDVLAVYRLLADAESRVHGVPVEEIHFHEVGNLDAVADVTAVCLLMRELAPELVLASPVHVGSGQVRCAHGLMPVPAPATAELLKGVPIYGGSIQGELCTPTGAALLKYYVNSFGPMPLLRTEAIGYGMGKKDFPAANCVRAILGQTEEAPLSRRVLNELTGRQIAGAAEGETEDWSEEVLELRCNLDDMTGEDIAYAAERLLEAGALDVWTQAIGMKKGRPGTMLCVLCQPKRREDMTSLLFRHTTTLGVRSCAFRRSVLDRQVETVETAFGPVGRKTASGFGVQQSKYEYEDLARIASEQGVSLETVRGWLK